MNYRSLIHQLITITLNFELQNKKIVESKLIHDWINKNTCFNAIYPGRSWSTDCPHTKFIQCSLSNILFWQSEFYHVSSYVVYPCLHWSFFCSLSSCHELLYFMNMDFNSDTFWSHTSLNGSYNNILDSHVHTNSDIIQYEALYEQALYHTSFWSSNHQHSIT